jgi:hypothetical protein
MRRSLLFLVLVLGIAARPAQAQLPDPIFGDGFDPLGPGDACMAPEECTSGFCVDDVCCNSSCGGVCEACDVFGAVGACSPVPNASDPDQECGGVSCIGYYAGWSGDSCRGKADVSAAQATCGGAGACRTIAQECTSSTQPGLVTTTCNALCQDPNLSTCTGTIAGTCTNVNPGNQTCGVGACLRTAPQCANGQPAACEPGAPSTETCDGIDNNCDGIVDNNGAFADTLEPNVSCANHATLTQVGSDQTRTQNNLTLYPTGDVDYFRIPALETDNSCGCGVFSTDEDYEMRVTLTVPPGAGSYEVCMNTDTCSWPAGSCLQVNAGASVTVSQYLDGACVGPGQPDSYDVFIRVSPLNVPGFSCRPYTLSYTFDAGLCR